MLCGMWSHISKLLQSRLLCTTPSCYITTNTSKYMQGSMQGLHTTALDSEARKHSKNSAGHVIASFSSLNLASLAYLVLVPDFVWLCFCMFLKFYCGAVGCCYKRTIAKVATISLCLILALLDVNLLRISVNPLTARLYGMLNGDRFVRAEH